MSENLEPVAVGAKTVANLDVVDWGRACFPIGVALPAGDEPWCALSLDELRILKSLLTLPLPGSPPACTLPGLETLLKWIESAERWFGSPKSRVVGGKLTLAK
jgi:hypothetical protein